MFPTEPPASSSGFNALLKNRPFLTLWIGQLVSQVADKIFFILLIALLNDYYAAPGMENSMRSTLMLTFTLPAILFGSAGGIFVDRFSKKQVLVGSDLIRGLLTMAIPWLPREFLILLVLTFLISTITQFFAPAEQATIPLLVRRENLMAANALFTTTMMAGLIVGFAVGEPILSLSRTWGEDYGREILVGGLYLVSAGLMQLIPIKEAALDPAQLATVHPLSDLKAGLRYLKQNRLVWNAMLQLTMLYSVFAALTVLTIDLASEIGLKSTQFGFLLAAAGVGMVFGAGILGNWGDRFHHKPLPLIGFLSMAFVLGVFSFINNLWLGLGLSILMGLGASMIGVPMQTLIQQQTPPAMHGKVFGFQNNAVNIALSAPLAITGPLTDAIGLRNVLVGMSLLVILVGVWAWHNTRRVLRNVL
ncbi:MFS transporter [Chroococcidiopsis sp. CCMEE 29]|uniref:MFS transporter n=1 Tax=Chroococcidiopsis sp. CCMEE 29 TaxID=155894 RepID=UPI0020223ADB|nr:MFS transporter [Chroococcidiopsis sp. CCMEE 29]